MGSHQAAVETPTLSDGRRKNKMQISVTVLASLLVLASSAPQNRPSLTRDRPQGRNQNGNSPNTRFFTGNQAIDSAAWGAALGADTQYFANQVFNPCRNRGGTRNSNTKGTNNRIFGNSNIDNGILGFLGGFAAASVAQNAGLTPNCG